MIIFMGVPGTGKSTQGRMLADSEGLPWLSTGEFLRMLISGQRRKDMLSGKLLDDTDTIALVRKIFEIVDTEHEFVLDGFPRTAGQADWLLSQVKHGQMLLTAVIHLQAAPEVVTDRLLQRGRQDDTSEAIQERFNEYEQELKPILEQFRQAGCAVYDINAAQEINKIQAEIKTVLKLSNANQS